MMPRTSTGNTKACLAYRPCAMWNGYGKPRVKERIRSRGYVRSATMTEGTAESETLLPFVESDPGAGAARLRATMAEQGYLFFRRLVPADVVMDVRRDVLEVCGEAGWIDLAGDLMDAVVAAGMQPTTEGQPEYMAV